jgi:ArsR family transcriptional regulator, virulence genes transcriptional regulator
MNIYDFETKAFEAAELLKMMGSEHRLMILCQLGHGEKSVNQLEKLLNLKQSGLSQHLGKLRAERLVETRRESQTIYYRLASPKIEKIIETLYELYSPPKE